VDSSISYSYLNLKAFKRAENPGIFDTSQTNTSELSKLQTNAAHPL